MRNKIIKPYHEALYHAMKIITVFTLIVITLFAFPLLHSFHYFMFAEACTRLVIFCFGYIIVFDEFV